MYLKLYVIILTLLIILDAIWIGVVAKNFYLNNLGHLMRPDIQWMAAIIFYLIYAFGILFLVILPSLKEKSLSKAILYGSLLGLICYATYDLTNLATLKGWPFLVTFVDLIWGTIFTALVATLTFFIARAWL